MLAFDIFENFRIDDFFDTMNYITASWMMPIAGLLTTLFIGYVMKKELTREEFRKGTRMGYLFRPWFFIMRYLAPIAIIFIILEEAGIVDIKALF